MRTRRLRKPVAALEVTAFINLIIVLVPFLLSTAVFSQMAVHELTLPAANSQAQALDQLKGETLQLTVVLREHSVEVSDREQGLIQRLVRDSSSVSSQALVFTQLNMLAQQIKQRAPQTTAVTLLAEPQIQYDIVVQAMDALRTAQQVQNARAVSVALFPEISIGQAPAELLPQTESAQGV